MHPTSDNTTLDDTSADAEPKQRRARRKDARPGELVDAALALFVEKGFAATRVEEVAARAGVSKGTLFLYFPSKEELFKAVVRENISGRFAEWDEEIKQFQGSSQEMLHYCLHSWWERIGMTAASGITKLVMSEASMFPEIAAFYQQEVIGPGHDLLPGLAFPDGAIGNRIGHQRRTLAVDLSGTNGVVADFGVAHVVI